MATVRLRPVKMSDAETCFRWVTDPDVLRYLGLTRPPRSLQEERRWISTVLADWDHTQMLMVEDEEGRPIGTCTLRGIDHEEGFAFLGILIGEKHLWDHGYGTAATKAALDIAFGQLGLQEVRLSCYSQNRRALRCYEKAGFEIVGREVAWQPEGGADLKMRITRQKWLALRSSGEGPGTATPSR